MSSDSEGEKKVTEKEAAEPTPLEVKQIFPLKSKT